MGDPDGVVDVAAADRLISCRIAELSPAVAWCYFWIRRYSAIKIASFIPIVAVPAFGSMPSIPRAIAPVGKGIEASP